MRSAKNSSNTTYNLISERMTEMKLKLFLATVLTISLGWSIYVDAESPSVNVTNLNYNAEAEFVQGVTEEDVFNALQEIDFGVDIEFSSLGGSMLDSSSIPMDSNDLMEFDSVEEFEAFLRLFINATSDSFPVYLEYSEHVCILDLYGPVAMQSPTYSAFITRTHNRYAIEDSLFGWRNIQYQFRVRTTVTANGQIRTPVDISILSSWTTGIVGATWTHRYVRRARTQSTNGSNTANLELWVAGTWFLGVSIGGLPVGASWNANWDEFVPITF